jgi:hypothetical protein
VKRAQHRGECEETKEREKTPRAQENCRHQKLTNTFSVFFFRLAHDETFDGGEKGREAGCGRAWDGAETRKGERSGGHRGGRLAWSANHLKGTRLVNAAPIVYVPSFGQNTNNRAGAGFCIRCEEKVLRLVGRI